MCLARGPRTADGAVGALGDVRSWIGEVLAGPPGVTLSDGGERTEDRGIRAR